MIITGSDVTLQSVHSLERQYNVSEQLSIQPAAAGKRDHESGDDRVSISAKAYDKLAHDLDRALKHLEKHMAKMDEDPEKEYEKAMKDLAKDLDRAMDHLKKFTDRVKEADEADGDDGHHRLKIDARDPIEMVGRIIEALTGRAVTVSEVEDDREKKDGHEKKGHEGHGHDNNAWNIDYSRTESYYESERTAFNAGGVVRTADGREINFSLDMLMSRQYLAERNIGLNLAGVRADDLVVDLGMPASELSDTAFSLAPASDGGESISYLSIGGGVLSLDLNGDGIVNDMSEIVGAEDGDGFAALSAYDEDGNGWIDEADSVFGSLGLYDQAAEAGGPMTSLGDAGVGAIYLGSVESPHSLSGADGVVAGAVEKSGVYLNEDGTPGAIQQLSVRV